MRELESIRSFLRPYATDVDTVLGNLVAEGKTILLEGQLGALRDPDHGAYPYVTSSPTLAGHGAVGGGVPPWAITRVICVTKAYASAVGAGPLATELSGREAERLRQRGGHHGEYGATTGRPRRVGWFDAVATRYGARIQGATEIALTNLDTLGYLKELRVAVRYRAPRGEEMTEWPAPEALAGVEPVYETLPGFMTDVSAVRRYEDLPVAAQRYVEHLEAEIGVPIRYISVGPHRDAMIPRS